MEESKTLGISHRKLVIFCGFLCLISVAAALGVYGGGYFGYRPVTTAAIARMSHWNYSLEDAKEFAYKNVLKQYRSSSYSTRNLSFDQMKSAQTKPFDIEGNDVLVFLHIQKTAGTTFEKFLVKHLENSPCECTKLKKKCKCYRPNGGKGNWLFSR